MDLQHSGTAPPAPPSPCSSLCSLPSSDRGWNRTESGFSLIQMREHLKIRVTAGVHSRSCRRTGRFLNIYIYIYYDRANYQLSRLFENTQLNLSNVFSSPNKHDSWKSFPFNKTINTKYSLPSYSISDLFGGPQGELSVLAITCDLQTSIPISLLAKKLYITNMS